MPFAFAFGAPDADAGLQDREARQAVGGGGGGVWEDWLVLHGTTSAHFRLRPPGLRRRLSIQIAAILPLRAKEPALPACPHPPKATIHPSPFNTVHALLAFGPVPPSTRSRGVIAQSAPPPRKRLASCPPFQIPLTHPPTHPPTTALPTRQRWLSRTTKRRRRPGHARRRRRRDQSHALIIQERPRPRPRRRRRTAASLYCVTSAPTPTRAALTVVAATAPYTPPPPQLCVSPSLSTPCGPCRRRRRTRQQASHLPPPPCRPAPSPRPPL